MVSLELCLEPLDPVGGADGGGGHPDEGLERGRVDGIEGPGAQRIEGHHSPWLSVDIERCTHAVVHIEVVAGFLHQAVIGVGQRRIGGKPHRLGAVEDLREAWLVLDHEAAAQRVAAQACDRAGHQQGAIPLEQCNRVAGEAAIERIEQPCVAQFARHRAGQVADYAGQVQESTGSSHQDINVVVETRWWALWLVQRVSVTA